MTLEILYRIYYHLKEVEKVQFLKMEVLIIHNVMILLALINWDRVCLVMAKHLEEVYFQIIFLAGILLLVKEWMFKLEHL